MLASRKKLLILTGVLVTILAFYAGYSLYWHLIGGDIASVSSDCVTVVSNGQSNLPDWVNSCGKGPKVVVVDSSEFLAHPSKYLSGKYPVLIYGSNLRDALRYLGEKMHVRVNGTPDAAIVFKENTIALVYKGANLAFILKNLPHLSINDSNARTVLAAAPYKGATVITQLSIYRKNTTIYKGILRFVSSYLPKNITFQASLWYNKTHNIAFSEIKTFTTPFTIPPTTCYWDEAMGSSDMLLFSGSNIIMGNDNITIGHTCSRKIGHPVVDAFKLGLTVEEQKGSVIVYPMPNIAPYNSLSIEIYLSK
ncbi:MAG: hypothetical protein GSR82_03000 [Desulfurococcales archaeon]|nr:hypothetical protein [Desulfurococcales archaeon]MEB3846186.1 hypothetical protein [Desulfurococcales archaeon]